MSVCGEARFAPCEARERMASSDQIMQKLHRSNNPAFLLQVCCCCLQHQRKVVHTVGGEPAQSAAPARCKIFNSSCVYSQLCQFWRTMLCTQALRFSLPACTWLVRGCKTLRWGPQCPTAPQLVAAPGLTEMQKGSDFSDILAPAGLRAFDNALMYALHVCRQRLSNDSFSLFLQAIKELNSGKKTREDTLHTAHEIFGASNGDLYGKLLRTLLHCMATPECERYEEEEEPDNLSSACLRLWVRKTLAPKLHPVHHAALYQTLLRMVLQESTWLRRLSAFLQCATTLCSTCVVVHVA